MSEICNVFSSNGNVRLLNYANKFKKPLHGHCLSSEKGRIQKGDLEEKKYIPVVFSFDTYVITKSCDWQLQQYLFKRQNYNDKKFNYYHQCVEGIRPFSLWRMVDGTTDGICSKRSNDVQPVMQHCSKITINQGWGFFSQYYM